MAEPKSFHLTRELHDYVLAHSTPSDEIERELIAATAELGDISMMQIAPEQAVLMRMLTQLIGATRAIEVGTFTGFSALSVARALGPEGHLLCCDVSEEWTSIGRAHWERAGVADRIELRIGPALETLRALPADPAYDIAFIDADKPNYIGYWDELVPRIRPNGLLIVDNVLWSGRVVDPAADDENTKAIRQFNDHLAADGRVDAVMLAISDGVTLARKR